MTPRILITAHALGHAPSSGDRVALDDRQIHYLARVLRLKAGDAVDAFDGRGRRWHTTLVESTRGFELTLGEASAHRTESSLAIHLGQCLSSAERMDWTIEKAVELGVTHVSPLTSERSQIKLDTHRAVRKLAHWQAIGEAACMQSGRDVLPAIEPVQPLTAWINSPGAALRLVLDPRAPHALTAAIGGERGSPPAIRLLVGPESGLSSAEIAAAIACGFQAVRLGPRILRTETAGLAALAAIQALAGDF